VRWFGKTVNQKAATTMAKSVEQRLLRSPVNYKRAVLEHIVAAETVSQLAAGGGRMLIMQQNVVTDKTILICSSFRACGGERGIHVHADDRKRLR
jgi:polyphosphate kinase